MLNHLDDNILNEYLDSALDLARRAEVEAHLAVCAECVAKAENLRALFADIESLPDVPLERDLGSGVVASIRRAPFAQPTVSPGLRLVVALQGLVALVLLAIALPLTAQTLNFANSPGFTSQASTIITDAVAAFNTTRATLTASTQSALAEGLTLINNLPWPSLSLLSLGAFFAAMSVMWLVGNGLLLTRTYQIKH